MKTKIFLVTAILLMSLTFVLAEMPPLMMDDFPGFPDSAKKVKAGSYDVGDGQTVEIKEQAQNRVQLKVQNAEAHSELEIKQEQVQDRTQLKVQLSNGRNAEVKIMPNVASEKALEQLRLRVCSPENNCSIELKEVGQGEETKLAYELQTKRQAKVFGLFRAQMQVKAQVDAETGELIQTKKPWWAFLATEPEEEQLLGESCGTVSPEFVDECCQNKGFTSWSAETQECI